MATIPAPADRTAAEKAFFAALEKFAEVQVELSTVDITDDLVVTTDAVNAAIDSIAREAAAGVYAAAMALHPTGGLTVTIGHPVLRM